MLSILGWALVVAGGLLGLFRSQVIRRVTSRSLGSLAPGFAATTWGYTIYALLVVDLGFLALGIDSGSALLIVMAIAVFIAGSIAVFAGEVVVFRRLKR